MVSAMDFVGNVRSVQKINIMLPFYAAVEHLSVSYLNLISLPALREAPAGRAYVLLMFFIYLYFTDFCQTNYLNICRTDLQRTCWDGRTTAVDLKLIFRFLGGRCVAKKCCGRNRSPIHTTEFARRPRHLGQSCPWVHFVCDPTHPNPTQPMGQPNPWTTLISAYDARETNS